MKNTRLMEVLFSAVEKNDEELANQVAKDIEDAKANGSVDTDEVKYESLGDGRVAITDKENGEVTVAEKAKDEDGTYDLYPAQPDQQIEGFIHPEGDGVTPGNQVGAPDEKVEDHLDGRSVISPNVPGGGLNPAAGNEKSVEDTAKEGPQPCENCEEKEFSVYSDNIVVQRIFSDQEFCERVFSEVIDSEETAVIGDLKVEKDPEEENAVVVTSESTGDQAKVKMDGEDMEVTELESKNFSEEEQYMPMYVVGVDPINHVIVDAPEYTEDSAQELVERLTEQGVDAVQVFDTKEEARDYAIQLLMGLGVDDNNDVEEPEQAEFSDHTIYLTRFYTDSTDYMCRLFSEAVNDVDASQAAIEDAIGNGDEIETDSEVITPVDAKTAVVEDKDNGELTKVSLDGEDMKCEPIDEEEADDLTKHIAVEKEGVDEDDEEEDEDDDDEDDNDEEEKDFSDIYCDNEETKFFSENEYMTDYMIRLFSDESDSTAIEDAIENGDQIETDKEVITPVDSKTAVIEDKENGEFTKAEMDDEKLDINPISEDEADELTDGLAVEDNDEDEDENCPECGKSPCECKQKEESCSQKSFSLVEGDVYCDEAETKFFSENEEMTDYMLRLFSEEADSADIEKAIDSGEEIETDKEVITPISETEAVIEDKENGEFTKAEMNDEEVEVHPLTEEEADKMVEDAEKCDGNCKEGEKKFSDNPVLEKFFADITQQAAPVAVAPVAPVAAAPAQPVAVAPEQAVVAQPTTDGTQPASVEQIEDKALAAIQSIRAVTEEAAGAIMEAKQAPVESQEADLKEAQFSEKDNSTDTLVSWLSMNKLSK